jgi:hypothetical protein
MLVRRGGSAGGLMRRRHAVFPCTDDVRGRLTRLALEADVDATRLGSVVAVLEAADPVAVAGRRDLDDGDGHGVDVDPVQAPRGMAVCNEAAQRVLEIGRVRNRDAAQVARPCVLDSGCTSGASPSPPSRATSSPPLVRDPRCRTELPQYATRLRCAPAFPGPIVARPHVIGTRCSKSRRPSKTPIQEPAPAAARFVSIEAVA